MKKEKKTKEIRKGLKRGREGVKDEKKTEEIKKWLKIEREGVR